MVNDHLKSEQHMVAVEARVPAFHRSNSLDKYTESVDESANKQSLAAAKLKEQMIERNEIDLINLLKNCEAAARPISFETIDLVQQNARAEEIVKALTGNDVDDHYRQMKAV